MNKRNPLLQQRNENIRNRFYDYIRFVPNMVAYAQLGTEFSLSEDRIRDIVAHRR